MKTSSKKQSARSRDHGRSLAVAGLFAGIGGIELGLQQNGHHTELLCELDPWATAVLKRGFPEVSLHPDITTLKALPKVDVVTAGFPCQDISLAGTRAGLDGSRSGLVGDVFRLIRKAKPESVILENVHHLLKLRSGANLQAILDEFEYQGYRWAYRVVDSRGFGLPQRRQRVIILASRGDIEPSTVLFADAADPDIDDSVVLEAGHRYGFYWTEGKRGIGWARDAVPTIKGGSGLGIPSPPAVFDTVSGLAGTPTIRDAERMQGFQPDWTEIMLDDAAIRPGSRWRLVGNAVSVPVGEWLGQRLAHPLAVLDEVLLTPLSEKRAWPSAAMSRDGQRLAVSISSHVETRAHVPINEFLSEPLKLLSTRALRGYLNRATTGTKKFPSGFLEALSRQADEQSEAA